MTLPVAGILGVLVFAVWAMLRPLYPHKAPRETCKLTIGCTRTACKREHARNAPKAKLPEARIRR